MAVSAHIKNIFQNKNWRSPVQPLVMIRKKFQFFFYFSSFLFLFWMFLSALLSLIPRSHPLHRHWFCDLIKHTKDAIKKKLQTDHFCLKNYHLERCMCGCEFLLTFMFCIFFFANLLRTLAVPHRSQLRVLLCHYVEVPVRCQQFSRKTISWTSRLCCLMFLQVFRPTVCLLFWWVWKWKHTRLLSSLIRAKTQFKHLTIRERRVTFYSLFNDK